MTDRPYNDLPHAEPDHPKVRFGKVGILLANLILSKRPFSSGKAYESIWNHEAGESPLLTITKDQTAAIKAQMHAQFGDRVEVDFFLFFPLYPHYAGATSATANDQLFRALMEEKWQPSVRTVPAYYDEPIYIDALAKSVEDAYAKLDHRPDMLVTSYHGVPKRYLMEGDPYHCQCQKTSRLLRERLGWEDGSIRTTFQSKFGPEEWLQPYTVEEVARLAEAGHKRIAVIAPAFSADCIETLEEINEEIKESFEEAGGESFTYIPCLNDQPAHIDALSHVITENLKGWID